MAGVLCGRAVSGAIKLALVALFCVGCGTPFGGPASSPPPTFVRLWRFPQHQIWINISSNGGAFQCHVAADGRVFSSHGRFADGQIEWESGWPPDHASVVEGKLILRSSSGTFTYIPSLPAMVPECATRFATLSERGQLLLVLTFAWIMTACLVGYLAVSYWRGYLGGGVTWKRYPFNKERWRHEEPYEFWYGMALSALPAIVMVWVACSATWAFFAGER